MWQYVVREIVFAAYIDGRNSSKIMSRNLFLVTRYLVGS